MVVAWYAEPRVALASVLFLFVVSVVGLIVAVERKMVNWYMQPLVAPVFVLLLSVVTVVGLVGAAVCWAILLFIIVVLRVIHGISGTRLWWSENFRLVIVKFGCLAYCVRMELIIWEKCYTFSTMPVEFVKWFSDKMYSIRDD